MSESNGHSIVEEFDEALDWMASLNRVTDKYIDRLHRSWPPLPKLRFVITSHHDQIAQASVEGRFRLIQTSHSYDKPSLMYQTVERI